MTATAKKFKYGKGDENWVNTDALRSYRDANNLTKEALAAKIGYDSKCVQNWISRRRAPREVLNNLGVKFRGTRGRAAANKNGGGSLYCLYVDGVAKAPFVAFCQAMNLNAKEML